MRFLLLPLLALAVGTPAVAQTVPEPTTCLKVGEVSHRWIPDPGPELGNVSLQIPVTNPCAAPKNVHLQIEMLDADGFLVENASAGATVPPGADTVRIKVTMWKSVADRVARYEVTVEPVGS